MTAGIHMKPFITVQGPAAPLLLDNIDTDIIIRIERLSSLPSAELGPFAFEALRFQADGSETPDCVLNRDAFRQAPILLAGRNFGCGSSREGAVWALAGRGIRCVVAESFGEIFHANCFQNGVLPIVLGRADIEQLASEARDGAPVTVDLSELRIIAPSGRALTFSVDPMKRSALLDGLDELGRTLRQHDAISAWQARDRQMRPWIWQPVELP